MATSKLNDTGAGVSDRSRLDTYWKAQGFENLYKQFRTGPSIEKAYLTPENLNKVITTFHLREIGYGNWVTQEDRYNYSYALFLALYDLDKVLQFKKNIGLNGRLSFSIGARGKSAAVAHFEPKTFIINITRYQKNAGATKKALFLLTGGVGATAHEYGHALDYYFGMYRDISPRAAALSGGAITNTKFNQEKGPYRVAMDAVLDAIIWKVPGKTLSPYYERLKTYHNTKYMKSRNEIFARAFEKYVGYKLTRMGIKNKFLNETKYDPTAYLTDGEMQTILPKMDALIKMMRDYI